MSTTPDPKTVAASLGLAHRGVEACISLLDDDCTVPFIARYRKEQTGNLDEVQVAAVRDAWEALKELEKRREAIITAVREQEKLTPELEAAFRAAGTLTALEDLYLPYRPKRQTRAQKAIERGLEPLALALLEGKTPDPAAAAAAYVDAGKDVADAETALQGARDIIAEKASESAPIRSGIREIYRKQGLLNAAAARGARDEESVYRDYYEFSELNSKSPSHRILAMLRGKEEKALRVWVTIPEDQALAVLEPPFLKPLQGKPAACREQVKLALADGLERLIMPSLENELIGDLKEKADLEAIRVFASNLREVLMDSPLGPVPIIALDPGFRTGCKLVVLDAAGELKFHSAIYPLEPQKKTDEAAALLRKLAAQFKVRAIAIGNGTGGREAQAFCQSLGLQIDAVPGSVIPAGPLPIVMVNESGASIYSAGEIARAEFPDLDLTVRGAVSIGRRLMDPLAELVKLDPKSIGVGQYQHDVDQKALARSLEDIVSFCVNAVGVDLNTASPNLLKQVSGLTAKTAQALVKFRAENGMFRNRQQLLKVPGIGPKAFEQAAGFLRIRGGDQPLDQSAVHPESYKLVERMAADLGLDVARLIGNAEALKQLRAVAVKYNDRNQGVSPADLIEELGKPGRDPRGSFELFSFDETVHEITDLKPGMVLPGVVTNVTAFGAFVDIGVHTNGLVHVSQIASHFVKDPAEVVKPGQKVQARVLEVDIARKRIALSLKPQGSPGPGEGGRGGEPGGPGKPGPQSERGPRRGGREDSHREQSLRDKYMVD